MCDQTEVQYLPGDVVWVKLRHLWWPGLVQDYDSLPEEITSSLRKRPIATVKFFQEDSYEYVHKLDLIYRYNCSRKHDFIKKGLDLCRKKTAERPATMDFFPGDVVTAEELTGGDPNILQDEAFKPEEKTKYTSIFGSEKKKLGKKKGKDDSPIDKSVRRKKLASKLQAMGWLSRGITANIIYPSPDTPRIITHRRFLNKMRNPDAKSDYFVRIMEQKCEDDPCGLSDQKYQCVLCGYHTCRLNVIVLHFNSTHSRKIKNMFPTPSLLKGGSFRTPILKTMSEARKSTPQSKKRMSLKVKGEKIKPEKKDTEPLEEESSTPQPVKKEKGKPGRKRKVKVEVKDQEEDVDSAKKPKVLDSLLADWDEDVEQEEEEPEQEQEKEQDNEGEEGDGEDDSNFADDSTRLSSTAADTSVATNSKVFEFVDDDEDGSLEFDLTPNSKGFGRRIPRVIESSKDKKQGRPESKKPAKSKVSKKEKDADVDDFESLLAETSLPSLPSIPKSSNFSLDVDDDLDIKVDGSSSKPVGKEQHEVSDKVTGLEDEKVSSKKGEMSKNSEPEVVLAVDSNTPSQDVEETNTAKVTVQMVQEFSVSDREKAEEANLSGSEQPKAGSKGGQSTSGGDHTYVSGTSGRKRRRSLLPLDRSEGPLDIMSMPVVMDDNFMVEETPRVVKNPALPQLPDSKATGKRGRGRPRKNGGVPPKESKSSKRPKISESELPQPSSKSSSHLSKSPPPSQSHKHSHRSQRGQHHHSSKSPPPHQSPKSPSAHQGPKSPSSHQGPKSPPPHQGPKSPPPHQGPKSPPPHQGPKSPLPHQSPKSPLQEQPSKSLLDRSPKGSSHQLSSKSPSAQHSPRKHQGHQSPKSPHRSSLSPEVHRGPKSPLHQTASPPHALSPHHSPSHQGPKSPASFQTPKSPPLSIQTVMSPKSPKNSTDVKNLKSPPPSPIKTTSGDSQTVLLGSKSPVRVLSPQASVSQATPFSQSVARSITTRPPSLSPLSKTSTNYKKVNTSSAVIVQSKPDLQPEACGLGKMMSLPSTSLASSSSSPMKTIKVAVSSTPGSSPVVLGKAGTPGTSGALTSSGTAVSSGTPSAAGTSSSQPRKLIMVQGKGGGQKMLLANDGSQLLQNISTGKKYMVLTKSPSGKLILSPQQQKALVAGGKVTTQSGQVISSKGTVLSSVAKLVTSMASTSTASLGASGAEISAEPPALVKTEGKKTFKIITSSHQAKNNILLNTPSGKILVPVSSLSQSGSGVASASGTKQIMLPAKNVKLLNSAGGAGQKLILHMKPSPAKASVTASPKGVQPIVPKTVQSISPKTMQTITQKTVQTISPKTVPPISPKTVLSNSPKSGQLLTPKTGQTTKVTKIATVQPLPQLQAISSPSKTSKPKVVVKPVKSAVQPKSPRKVPAKSATQDAVLPLSQATPVVSVGASLQKQSSGIVPLPPLKPVSPQAKSSKKAALAVKPTSVETAAISVPGTVQVVTAPVPAPEPIQSALLPSLDASAGVSLPTSTQQLISVPTEDGTQVMYFIDNSALIGLDGSNQANLGNLIFTFDNMGQPAVSSAASDFAFTAPSSGQDILAEALANTQVLQSETTGVELGLDPSGLLSSHSGSAIYPPTLSHGVSETLTLNQPIMTPLEDLSAVSTLQPPPVSGAAASVELPLSIPQPDITISTSSYASLPIPSATIQSTVFSEAQHAVTYSTTGTEAGNVFLETPTSESELFLTTDNVHVQPSEAASMPLLDG